MTLPSRLAPRAAPAALLLLLAACGDPAPRVAGRFVVDSQSLIYATVDPFGSDGDLATPFGQSSIFRAAHAGLAYVSPAPGEQGKDWFAIHSDSTRADTIGYVKGYNVLVPEPDRDAGLGALKLVNDDGHRPMATVRPARIRLAPNPASVVVSTLPEGAPIQAGATASPDWIAVQARTTGGEEFVLGFVRREDVTSPQRLSDVAKQVTGCTDEAVRLVREGRDEAIRIDAAEEERNGPLGTGKGARERGFTRTEEYAINHAVEAYTMLQRDCPHRSIDG